jgi:uncharacterized protein YbjQ (UPF0145 family)
MKRLATALALACSLFVLTPAAASAEDALSTHELASVMERPDFASQFEGVRFYFGDAPHGAVRRRIERNVTTSLRTRRLGRSAEESCQWVLASSLVQLRGRAQALGGNAVINIRSNWQNVEWSSATQYKCAAGFLMAGVALKGDVVQLR